MATVPMGGGSLTNGVQLVQQPSRTWNINQDTGRIEGTTDGYDAVRQAIETILNVKRFRWQIYQPYSGVELQALIGQDVGYVAAELHRRARDALLMDDRVRRISNYTYAVEGDTLTASLTVETVYGSVDAEMEVNLA